MEPVRPEFVPDPSLSHEEMADLQREIANVAVFADDLNVDPGALTGATLADFTDEDDGGSDGKSDDGGEMSGDGGGDGTGAGRGDSPLVAGVDQAFVGSGDDSIAVSAIVLMRDGEVVERVSAAVETTIPYIPGLLSFREGGAILAAFAELDREPDVAFVDGSGRIHYREAGLATHIGVTLDLPAIGVAKRLLCGTPVESLEEKRPEGDRVAIEADDAVETATPGTTIGYAVQTRQFPSAGRHVNPLYVSPGHRVSAVTAADLVEATCAGYKLPEPTRRADAYADEAKATLAEE